MTPGGYHGRYLRVDLGDAAWSWIPLPEKVLRQTIGGVGLGTWLLLEESPSGYDPLAPEAPLIFAMSPMVGTPLTTSAKFAVVSKSPLTGRINDALSSSSFALAAKGAGFDALVVVGRCRRRAVLIIDGEADRIHMEEAGDLWGLSPRATDEALQARLATTHGRAGGRYQVAAIGRAGENLVRFASLSNGGRHAGRGGTGAVMGAKQLKAIAVRGHQQVALARPGVVRTAARDLSARSFGPATEKYRELGTVANLLVFNRLAVLPTRNFQASRFPAASALSGEQLGALRGHARASCAACTIGCEHIYGVRQDNGETGHVRMEYETLFALGSLCGVAEPAAVLEAAALCDELGMDTISAGATIAFAMECAEKNLLDPAHPPAPLDPPPGVGPSFPEPQPAPGRHSGDSWPPLPPAALQPPTRDGKPCRGPAEVSHTSRSPPTTGEERRLPPLAFGNGRAVLHLLGLMARRRGLGHLLAEGSRRAARAIGQGTADFAPHVKGMEIPGYEPRGLQAMALGLAVGSRGADHNRSSAYEIDFSEGADRMKGDQTTARRAVETEDRSALMDSLILCKFLRGVFHDFHDEAAALLSAVTGWDLTCAELKQTSRRIVTARKWFNQREGWTPAEDTLPHRFLNEPLKEGPSAGAALSPARLAAMITAYNLARGFTADGHVPLKLRQTLHIPQESG